MSATLKKCIYMKYLKHGMPYNKHYVNVIIVTLGVYLYGCGKNFSKNILKTVTNMTTFSTLKYKAM